MIKNVGQSQFQKQGYKSSPAECSTCASRKYKDGSSEHDVSFQTPTHIDPSQSASKVLAHEHEHVANAYEKEATQNAKVMSCSVTLKTEICPECGRSYVSGGTTSTQIKYYNEENPYQKGLKTQDSTKYSGMNLDLSVN